jgi:uncharacterized membrane protein YhdT
MNPFKLFLKLSLLQKVLFCLATFMFVNNIRKLTQFPIFDWAEIDGVKQRTKIKITEIETDKFDSGKINIEKENFNTAIFDSVSLNYGSDKPYLLINYHSVSDYVFSKLWLCKMLIISKFIFEEIILLLILLIVLVVKQNNFFSKNVIKLLKIIVCLLVSLPIIYFTKDFILLSFLHDNFKGNLSNLGLYSKAQNFFYPLFFALIIFMIIDVFQKGINLKQENDLTI